MTENYGKIWCSLQFLRQRRGVEEIPNERPEVCHRHQFALPQKVC